MGYITALLMVVATAVPPDFSGDPNLRVLAPSGTMYETSMVLSGNTAVLAVISVAADHAINVFVSNDRGVTWSGPSQMPTTAGGKTFRNTGDPTLAVLDDGSFGLAYLVMENDITGKPQAQYGNTGLVFLRSTDGVTWSSPLLIVSGTAPHGVIADRPWLSFVRIHGLVYLSWTRANPADNTQDLVYVVSSNRGATWTAPVAATPVRNALGRVAPLPNGTLAAVSSDTATETYVSRILSSGSASWSDPQTLVAAPGSGVENNRTKTRSDPMARLLTYRDDLYALLPTPFAIVYFARSRDGGQTWSTPLQLAGASADAVVPAMAVDEASGTLFVSWLDGRDDPANKTLRLYGTRSTDGGATFESPRAFSPPFAAGGWPGDVDEMIVLGNGTVLRTFSPAGGYMTAARLSFVTRRRAANH